MVKKFSNPFFSKAGQVERLKNAGATLKSSITGKGVQSNTGNQTADKILSAAASNPFTTAAVVTPVNTLGAAKAGFQALSTGGKLATVAAAPVVASVVLTNPQVVGDVAQAPRSAANFAANASEFINNPSLEKAKETFKENPVITGAIGAGVALVAGGAVGAAVNYANTRANTKAVKDNTRALSGDAAVPTGAVQSYAVTPNDGISTTAPVLPVTQAISTSRSSGLRKRRKSKQIQQVRQSVRVNVVNNSRIQSYIKKRSYY